MAMTTLNPNRRRRVLIFFAGVIAMMTLPTLPALGHPAGYLPDGANHGWCLADSTIGHPNVRDAMRYGMVNLDNQTDMSENGPLACSTGIDVQFGVGNAGGARGQWQCINFSGGVCFRSRIEINPTEIQANGGPYVHNLKKTACHEVGHSVGHNHHAPPYGDCLVSGRVDAGHLTYNYDHYIFINNNF